MSNEYILNFLEGFCPDKIPTTKLTEFEYGVLAGQRLIIEQLKIKLKVEEDIKEVK